MSVEQIEDIYPLSPMQAGMLFHSLYAPGSGVYVGQFSWKIQGTLDMLVFIQAWQRLVDRYPVLRTSCVWEDIEEPLQIVRRHATLPLQRLDWRELPEDEQQTRLAQFLADDRRRGFDLAEAPLARLSLIALADDIHQMTLSCHHLIMDGWSLAIVLREFLAFYEALRDGHQLNLPRSRPYRDYIAWLKQQDISAAAAFWQRTLAGFSAPTPLIASDPPPGAQGDDQQELCVSEATTAALQALAQQQQLTINTLMQGAWALLLSRYSREQDVLFGAIVAGRPPELAGVERMVGLFINTLPVRTQVAPDAPLISWLKQMQTQQVEARQYEYSPLVQVQGWSDVPRSMGLFESVLVFENYPVDNSQIAQNGSLVFLQGRAIEQGNYPLIATAGLGAELIVRIIYARSRFDAPTVTRMLGHLQTLLESIAADPSQALADIPLLTEAERHQLLVEWNATDRPYPTGVCFQTLFEARVARAPEATAVAFEGTRLSYEQLNRRANRLAHLLVERGVGADTVVALLAERGPDLLTAIIAIFKAGGAYLPLDPRHPAHRYAQVLEQSGSGLVLAAETFLTALAPALDRLPADRRPEVLGIEALLECDAAEENLARRADPDDLAYVIYTSGSTGAPKGAMVEQRGMLNHLYAKISDLELSEADCVAQTASQCFDISVWQFLSALLVGGYVRIYPDEVAFDPWQLLRRVEQDRVTILETVPSLLRAMLETDTVETGRPALRALRWLIPTGEALPPDLARQWLAAYPGIPLLNAYGPTECSDDVTHYPLHQPPAEHLTQMPIGRPIGNMRMYILDERMQPVPVGVAGELYVGGVGVGRGYLNDAERTAEAFVTDPFADERRTTNDERRASDKETRRHGDKEALLSPIAYRLSPDSLETQHSTLNTQNSRLYTTGDLARYQEDGNIVFLGRLDHQVKIRGFRIELGEIESVLEQHPAVQAAVVIDRELRPGEQSLVAYIVQDPAYQGADGLSEQQDGKAWQAAQVEHWQAIYDDAYSQAAPFQDPTFNTSSWNSSYSGEAVPEAEMREYVAQTVERALARRPRRGLEIGCGTGLLLFRIAPHCESYCGTDISPVALRYIEQQVAAWPEPFVPLQLLLKEADNFDGFADGSFDVVVLNSVVQLFPSMDYLVRVLAGAVEVVAPGGVILIGDVRSLPLLETFHTSVQLHRAEASLGRAELRQRVQRALSREKDMAIDPDFFFALQQHLPAISHVQIQLKRGHYHNEFTRFRYDVRLYVGAATQEAQETVQLDWQEQQLSLPELRRLLVETQAEAVQVMRVPNGRILADVVAQRWLAGGGGPDTAGELRAAVQEAAQSSAVDPEDLWAMCDDLRYTAVVTWHGSGAEGWYDVIFRRSAPGEAGRPELIVPTPPAHTVMHKPWHYYANNPLQTMFVQEVIPQLREYLLQRLPDYMLPSAFVALESLPLTANGKVDRRALPAPDQTRTSADATYLAPRDQLEQELAAIWEELLNIRPVGANDSFFDLGGHSILAVRLMSQIQQQYGRHLPLSVLFQNTTIEKLASLLRAEAEPAAWSSLVAIQPAGPRAPFFCVHPGGGNILSYHRLAQLLGDEQPFYGLQAVGLDARQEPLNRFEAMAAHYIGEIRRQQPQGPYLLGGWCTGGRIAFEIARQLQEAGEEVGLLAMFDSAVKYEVPGRIDMGTDVEVLLHRVPAFERYAATVADLDAEERLVAIVEQARRAGEIAEDMGLDQIRAILHIYRAMMQAEQAYVAQPNRVRVALLRAIEHSREEAEDLGWGALALQGVEVLRVPGDHISIVEDPDNVKILAEHLRAQLDQANQKELSIVGTND